MDKHTAKHLNHLLDESKPCTIIDRPSYWQAVVTGPSSITKDVANVVRQIVKTCLAQAQEEEIAEAAREHRAAESYDGLDYYSSGLGVRAFTLARPEIEAYLARSNAERLSRYEAFRVACEQRTAQAPKEE